MRITDKTKYATLQPVERYLEPAAVADLKAAAERLYGSMYDLTFETFYACTNEDFSGVLGDLKNPTVLQVYWCKRFAEFTAEFAKALKAMTLPQTADEKAACAGLIKTDWAEGMLVFMQQYFGLRSFKEAEQITIGELLIAKRARYNQDKYQRELANIQRQKMRAKK